MSDYTVASTIPMYVFMGSMLGGAIFALAVALRSGAVKDDETPKFRMLRDDLDVEPQDHARKS